MSYVTTIERFAIERGKVAQAREAVVQVLTVRLGSVPDALVENLTTINDLEQLNHLLQQAVLIESDSWCEAIAEFQALI
jgi:hypothetical protein